MNDKLNLSQGGESSSALTGTSPKGGQKTRIILVLLYLIKKKDQPQGEVA